MTTIQLKDVSKVFRLADGTTLQALDKLSLTLDRPKIFALVGPNGAGKSTALNIIAGLLQPDAGSIEIVTQNHHRPHIGYVWQNYRASLLPWANAAENVAFGAKLQGVPRDVREGSAINLLRQFAPTINPRQKCYELSGGQQQLLSVLRSFAVRPDVLLADEPTSALDPQARWSMIFQIEKVWMSNPVPTLYVSHDIDEAVLIADDILLMSRNGGHIERRITNPLPRPRHAEMLSAPEHVELRRQILEFLFRQRQFPKEMEHSDYEAKYRHNRI